MWLFVHLFQLIGYRNRISTMWTWTNAYFTQDQSLGMIIRPSEKLDANEEPVKPLMKH
jgi:NADH dehydrogenase